MFEFKNFLILFQTDDAKFLYLYGKKCENLRSIKIGKNLTDAPFWLKICDQHPDINIEVEPGNKNYELDSGTLYYKKGTNKK